MFKIKSRLEGKPFTVDMEAEALRRCMSRWSDFTVVRYFGGYVYFVGEVRVDRETFVAGMDV